MRRELLVNHEIVILSPKPVVLNIKRIGMLASREKSDRKEGANVNIC